MDDAAAAQVLDFYRSAYRSAFVNTAPAELLRIVIAAPNVANLETVVEVCARRSVRYDLMMPARGYTQQLASHADGH